MRMASPTCESPKCPSSSSLGGGSRVVAEQCDGGQADRQPAGHEDPQIGGDHDRRGGAGGESARDEEAVAPQVTAQRPHRVGLHDRRRGQHEDQQERAEPVGLDQQPAVDLPRQRRGASRHDDDDRCGRQGHSGRGHRPPTRTHRRDRAQRPSDRGAHDGDQQHQIEELVGHWCTLIREFGFAHLRPEDHRAERNRTQPFGSAITESMAWIMPLLASMSGTTTVAPPTTTSSPSTSTSSRPPCTVSRLSPSRSMRSAAV